MLEFDRRHGGNDMRVARAAAFESKNGRGCTVRETYAKAAIEHDDAERQGANQRIEAIVFRVFVFVFPFFRYPDCDVFVTVISAQQQPARHAEYERAERDDLDADGLLLEHVAAAAHRNDVPRVA